MQISIDSRSPLPVFAQLVRQIREAVRGGRLKPGASLPAIRQLAVDLQINPNTVAKAYARLERDAIIETRGHRGSFVHADARRHALVDRPAQATATLTRAVTELRAAGLTNSEIRIAFARVMRN